MKSIPDKLVADGSVLSDDGGMIIFVEVGRNLYPSDYDSEWKEKFARTIARRYNLGAKIEKKRRANSKLHWEPKLKVEP